jgi:hypothetical protein
MENSSMWPRVSSRHARHFMSANGLQNNVPVALSPIHICAFCRNVTSTYGVILSFALFRFAAR